MRQYPVAVGGLVIALIGFVLTRFTVTLAAEEMSVQFIFAGVVPLVLGLSLSAFGVVLAVSTYERSFIRTTARWCVLGTIAMLVFVVLTLLGTDQAALTEIDEAREQTYLSNFLIGGAIGGTLTGIYAAQNQRHRENLRQQANRLELLNRMLRDQVINAATAIKGHSEVLEQSTNERSLEVVDNKADAIVDMVENVRYLSESTDSNGRPNNEIVLEEVIQSELDSIDTEYPEAVCSFSSADESVTVQADGYLHEVFSQLFENAIAYADADQPQLDVETAVARHVVTVRIRDTGPGLPESQQAILERGEIAEYDDPTTGFGLNIVRLLVEQYGGAIRTTVDGGTTIEIDLPRANTRPETANKRFSDVGVPPSRIGLAIGVAIVAGLTMGAAMAGLGDDLAVIGALYGIEDLTIALITHEFHSIVFALVYAGALSALPRTYTDGLPHRLLLGVGLGLFLWLVAAGLVMPLWLELVGVDATFPNLTVPSLAGHVVWGLTVSSLYHVGDQLLDQSTEI